MRPVTTPEDLAAVIVHCFAMVGPSPRALVTREEGRQSLESLSRDTMLELPKSYRDQLAQGFRDDLAFSRRLQALLGLTDTELEVLRDSISERLQGPALEPPDLRNL